MAEHSLQLPEPVEEFYIDVASDGTIYLYASERARHWTGPEVRRWILHLDITTGKTDVVTQYDHIGCCTLGNLGVDPSGVIWWVVNPEFELYRVTPDGERALLARNLPTDAAAVIADSEGDIYLSSPSGIIRIYREP